MKTAPKKATRIKAGHIQRANYKWIYLFLLPTIVIFAMFYLMPIAQVFVTSFTKWDGFNAPKFNGLTNYINLFTNSSFLIALKNLLWWCVIALTLHVGFGTLVAFVLYLHLFAEGQPDLNWENPEVRDQVFDMMNFWFQKGIDGFRMDVISMISKAGYADGPLCADGLYGDYTDQCTNGPRVHEYLQEMNRRVLSHYDCMTVGENANVTPELACLYAGEDRHELNMVFQFELMDVDGGESRKWEPEHPWKLTDIKKIQTRWQTGLDGKAWNSLYWNNHDQPRVVSRFGCTKDEESRVRSAKMLAVCLYLMQGTPYIYQGEELGMTNKHFDSIDPINDVMTRNAYFEKTQRCGESVADFMKAANYISREHTRTPMHWDDTANAGFTTGTPWIPLNPNYPQINAAKQVGDPDSVYSFYRRLLALRKSDKTFVYGHYALLLPDDEEIYAYTRTLNDEQILVVCNFTDHDVPCPLLNDWQNTELLISNYNTPGNPGSLRPFEAVVYRK